MYPKRIKLHKLTDSMTIHIGSYKKNVFACEACGCLVFDKLEHARFMHGGATPDVANTFTDDDRMKTQKVAVIREAGKKIVIVKNEAIRLSQETHI